jgi:hypothetical protein
MADTTAKNFYATGFDALIKQWEKCINVGKINAFPGSGITCFTFCIHSWPIY